MGPGDEGQAEEAMKMAKMSMHTKAMDKKMKSMMGGKKGKKKGKRGY